jgi:hypothetical protein
VADPLDGLLHGRHFFLRCVSRIAANVAKLPELLPNSRLAFRKSTVP